MDILSAEWLDKPVWMWAGFLAVVLALLAFDLGVLNRKDRDMGIAQSLWLSAFYIGFAMITGTQTICRGTPGPRSSPKNSGLAKVAPKSSHVTGSFACCR